jgi:hypothetical protein
MSKTSPRLCIRTIAADGVICTDGHDVLWSLGRLFDACLLLRNSSFLDSRTVMSLRSKYSFDVSYLPEASLKLVQTLQRKTW